MPRSSLYDPIQAALHAIEKGGLKPITCNISQLTPLFEKPVNSTENLLDAINQSKQKLANAKGISIAFEGKNIRLVDGSQNFVFQESDLYARGLQFAYATIRIGQLEGVELNPQKINAYLHQFTENFAEIEKITPPHTPETFAKAKQTSLEFIDMLAHEMVQTRMAQNDFKKWIPKKQSVSEQTTIVQEQKNKAFKDLKKAVELYNTVEPPEDAICTFMKNSDDNYSLQLSERLTFKVDEQEINAAHQQFQQAQPPAWYKQNSETHGKWFKKFMDNKLGEFLQSSPPSSTRDLPNPANAWKETFCNMQLSSERPLITQEHVATRIAISSPFHLKGYSERVTQAKESMQALLSASVLDDVANDYIKRWGPLLPNDSTITLPLLHQTLVAPITGPVLWGPDRNMIAVKNASNALLRTEYLEKLPEKIINTNGKMIKINYQLYETNNCVNIWHTIATPRNNDIEHSNQLIQHTTFLIEQLRNKVSEFNQHFTPEIDEVVDFLKDQRSALLPVKPLSHREPNSHQQKAIENVCEKLIQGNYTRTGLNFEQQKDLALILQASVNLKKINYETTLGTLKRKIDNSWRVNELAVLAPLTGIIASPFYIGRYLINTTNRVRAHLDSDEGKPAWNAVFLPTLNGYKNKQTFKSAYEKIIAGETGIVYGGCKSALDRAGEVELYRAAMVQYFHQEGKLIDFDAPDADYYKFLKIVEKLERSGHQNNVAASRHGSPARKMWETLNHHYSQTMTAAERKIEKVTAGFREIKAAALPDAKASAQNIQHYALAAQSSQFTSISPPPLKPMVEPALTASHTQSLPAFKQHATHPHDTETKPKDKDKKPLATDSTLHSFNKANKTPADKSPRSATPKTPQKEDPSKKKLQ